MPQHKEESLDNTSANAYASILKAKITDLNNCSIVLYNGHATSVIKYKILVSNDPEGAANTWAEDKAEATLNGVTAVRHVLTGAFVYVDVQIASNVADTHSDDVDAWLYAQRG